MFDYLHSIIPPPLPTNADGTERQVGVEVEFAGLSAGRTAQLIADFMGGTVTQIDAHRFDVTGTPYGTFRSELDSRFVHPEALVPASTQMPPWVVRLGEIVAEGLGSVGAAVIPCEVITPPLPISEMTKVDRLIEHLKKAGAQGTDTSVFYAFGVHLNPEIARPAPEWILSVVKAQILLSPWLRMVMEIDTSRYLTGFAMPYRPSYSRLVLQPSYAPDRSAMIDDYIAHNPSRDHELDMLPLFAWMEPEHVRNMLPDQKISARPTFHHRLPNAALERSDWSIVLEWNRWCLIERLATDADKLRFLAGRYLEFAGNRDEERWTRYLSEWLVHDLHDMAAGSIEDTQ